MNVFAPDEIDFKRIAATVRDSESGYFGDSASSGMPPTLRRVERVTFRNDYSGTVPEHGLMRVTGIETLEKAFVLKTNRPDSTYRWLYLVNGDQDVKTGKRGWGTWLWHAAHVLYNTAATPAYAEQWGPEVDAFTLKQHRPGFFILGGTTGTGATSRVLAMQLPPGQVLVKNSTGSAIAAAASGTATVHGGVAGSEATTAMTLTVYNRSSVSWANDKYGTADLINGQAYVSPQQT